MNRSSFVPVVGELARPGATSLSGIPFGREWLFRGAAGARPRKGGIAALLTSCIDITAPHRSCGWKPLSEPQPEKARPAGAQVDAARGAPRRITLRRPTLRKTRKPSRATIAAGWTLGALTIIGGLVAAYAPLGAPLRSAGTQFAAASHAITSPIVALVGRTRVDESKAAAARVAAQPTAAGPKVTAQAIPATSPADPMVAAAGPHTPAAASGHDESARPAPSAVVRRVAATPLQPSSRTDAPAAARARKSNATAAAGAALPSGDPRALIALANTLRAEQPAFRSSLTPLADIDWTARLSHRRLSDTPDMFAR